MPCIKHADAIRALLQITHLAQMKSVYPEIFSLRYANIPKTNVEGQASGIQLIIDMSLSDTAAEPMSAVKPAALAQSVTQLNSHSTRLEEASTTTAVPSSTQAMFKTAGAAVTATNTTALESVCKRAVCNDAVTATGGKVVDPVSKKGGSNRKQNSAAASGAVAGESPSGAVAAQSPTEPLRMLAVKAEFERRLEKQVGSLHAAMQCITNICSALKATDSHSSRLTQCSHVLTCVSLHQPSTSMFTVVERSTLEQQKSLCIWATTGPTPGAMCAHILTA